MYVCLLVWVGWEASSITINLFVIFRDLYSKNLTQEQQKYFKILNHYFTTSTLRYLIAQFLGISPRKHIWKAHEGRILSMGLSHDDHKLATCGKNGILKLWNVQTGQYIKRFRCYGFFYQLKFSLDDTILLSRTDPEQMVNFHKYFFYCGKSKILEVIIPSTTL